MKTSDQIKAAGRKQYAEMKQAKQRLEYLRGELRAERISYGELHELQDLKAHIEPGDVELLEAAGVPEFPDEDAPKHTPGPWIVETHQSQADPSVMEHNVVFPGCDRSANGRPKAVDRFVIATVNGFYFGPHHEEPEANARLIAAAPELLEALKALLLHFPSTKDPSDALALEQSRAAIARATGGEI